MLTGKPIEGRIDLARLSEDHAAVKAVQHRQDRSFVVGLDLEIWTQIPDQPWQRTAMGSFLHSLHELVGIQGCFGSHFKLGFNRCPFLGELEQFRVKIPEASFEALPLLLSLGF